MTRLMSEREMYKLITRLECSGLFDGDSTNVINIDNESTTVATEDGRVKIVVKFDEPSLDSERTSLIMNVESTSKDGVETKNEVFYDVKIDYAFNIIKKKLVQYKKGGSHDNSNS